MLVKVKQTTVVDASFEIALPAYYRTEDFVPFYYAITEEETVIRVYEYQGYTISSWTKEDNSRIDHVAAAIKGEPVSERVFMEAYSRALNFFENTFKSEAWLSVSS